MRILYLHQHFSTPKGAAGIRSYQMARRLVERGHQVTMVCGSFGNGNTGLEGPFDRGVRRGTVEGIDVIECDIAYSNQQGFATRIASFSRFMLQTIRLVFAERYDVMFATTTPLTVGVPGVIARWLRGKPFVFEVRDLWPELPKAMGVIRNPILLAAMRMLEWSSYKSAHRLIGLSPGIVEGIKRDGVPDDRVAAIPNGCDLDIFRPGLTPERPEGVSPGDLMAVFTGTHGLANGLDRVLDAASVLKRRGRTDIKIVLVGTGMCKPALVERAAAEGLTNVLLLPPMPKDRLAGLVAGADLGLQILANVPAFYYGTSPNKFFDYISAGLPVLNNYPGWLAQLIAESECGFAVPPEDADAFADALEAAAADREALEQMGRNARALAEREFDREMLADKWVDWVTGVLSASRNTRSSIETVSVPR